MKIKQYILIPVLTWFCIILFIHKATSQVSTPMVLNIVAASVNTDQNSAMPSNTASLYRNDISIRAVRDFIKEFKDAKNVTWRKARDGGYTARFNNDSIQTMVSYNQKGSCVYTSKKYGENKMPERLRSLVKLAFSQYVITQVIEINLSPGIESIMYSVLINYVKNFKILKISKGQMEIVSDYSLQ